MPVLDVTEDFKGSSGWDFEGTPGEGDATVTRNFHATITPDVRPNQVELDLRIPQPGSSLPWNADYYCRRSRARQIGPTVCHVASEYYLPVPPNGANDDNSPLSERARVSFRSINSREEVDEDVDGNAIVTANNEPLKPERLLADQEIIIKKNLPAWDPSNIDNFVNSVNSDSFFGFPAGRLRIDSLEANETTFGNGLTYFQAEARLLSRKPIQTTDERAWWVRVLHQGFKVKVTIPASAPFPGGDFIINATDEDGNLVSKPVMLDSDGMEVTDPANAEWLEFQVYETVAFNNLGMYP